MAHKFDVSHKQKLDSTERKKLLPPDEILKNFNIGQGALIADIGCGTGYFTIPAAKIAGVNGKVFALDISNEMLMEVRQRATAEGLDNIEAILMQEYQIPLASNMVTNAFLAFVLHESEQPKRLLNETKRILKEDAQITIIEWEKKEAKMGPPVTERLSQEEVISYLTEAGFVSIEATNISQEFYGISAVKANVSQLL